MLWQHEQVGGERGAGMKILVVDDHALVREGLRHVLQELDEGGVEVIEAGSGGAAFAAAARNPDLDLVVLDLHMPDIDGIEALDELGRSHPEIPVVVLSGVDDVDRMRAAFDHGAAGFIHKSVVSDVLVSAIRLVFSGGVYVPPQMLEHQVAGMMPPLPSRGAAPAQPLLNLTERQREVLRLVLQGRTNKEICRILTLAEPTVKVHVSAILRILGVQSRTQAVLAAARLGLDVFADHHS
jgi:DNA-binding NarL/FixJ family response regulator